MTSQESRELHEWQPPDARAFWGLKPEHPLREGWPYDTNIGRIHIAYNVAVDHTTGAHTPSYDVHDRACECFGHLHDEPVAVQLAYLLNAIGLGLMPEIRAVWDTVCARLDAQEGGSDRG